MNMEDCPEHKDTMNPPYPFVCDCPDGVCPCGYRNECHIWCGSGHETGMCPSHEEW